MTQAPGAWRIERDGFGHVRIRRPYDLDAAMRGAPIERAGVLAASLHALCPHAHRIAYEAALEAALGQEPSAERDKGRAQAMTAEAAGAAALRLGMFWPHAFGVAPAEATAPARRAAHDLAQAALAGEPSPLIARSLGESLLRLADAAQTLDMADLAHAALADMADPEAPSHPLALRIDAMLSDTRTRAAALREGRIEEAPLARASGGDGVGAAIVQSVRGPLHVSLAVRDGKIVNFESNAPTDRLMAPGGPIARAVAAAEGVAQAHAALIALDPCAAVELRLAPAEAEHA